MEELRFYLDLVAQLGDPFTIFERDWPDDTEEAPEPSGQSSSVDPPTTWFPTIPSGYPFTE